MVKYKLLNKPNASMVLTVYRKTGNVPLDQADTKAVAIKKANKLHTLNEDIVIVPKYSYGEKRPYRYEIFGNIRKTKDVKTKVGKDKLITTMIKTPKGWKRLSSSRYPGFYK